LYSLNNKTVKSFWKRLAADVYADIYKESDSSVKCKPDLMLILMAVFGMGVVVTLMLPMAANNTVAAPASELQAGVIIRD
jgi:hypothetical protein